MVFSKILFAAVAGAVVSSASSFTYEVIDQTSSDAHIQEIEFEVSPPGEVSAGESVVVAGSGVISLGVDVTGGSYSIDMVSLGLPIFSHTGPVCGDDGFDLPLDLGNATVSLLDCPETAGDRVTLDINVNFKAAPPADVQCTIRAYQQGKEEMITFALNVFR